MARGILYAVSLLTLAVHATHWCTDLVSTNEDSKLLPLLQAQPSPVTYPCLKTLVEMNKFESTKYALKGMLADSDPDKVKEVYQIVTEGAAKVQSQYAVFNEKILARKRIPIKVSPPFIWF